MNEDNSFHPLQRVKTNTDNVIITEKELNYVETLYISYIHKLDYNQYIDIINVVYDLEKEGLGVSSGRTWFKFDNYRIGFMDYTRALSSGNYLIEIQYEYKHLFEIKGNLSLLDFPFFLSDNLEDYRIKRIDITKIMKIKDFDFSPINIGYISRMRKLNWYEGTLYIGSRKSGQVMRIYNKTKELVQKENLEKEKLLKGYFNSIEDLITCELELRSKTLKEKYDIIKLSNYKKAIKIFNDVIGSVALYELNDKNRKLREQQNQNRIKKYYLEKYEEVERMKRDKYYYSQRDIQLRKIKKELTKYIDMFVFSVNDELELVSELLKELDINNNYELLINETDDNKEYKKMMDRLKEFNYEWHTNLKYEAEKYLTYKHKNSKYINKIPEN